MRDGRFPLSTYPYVVVRLSCRYCERRGSYRLARLAAKFGAEADIYDRVLPAIAGDCAWWHERPRGKKLGCGVYLPDLEPTMRPPDLPSELLRLRLVKSDRR